MEELHQRVVVVAVAVEDSPQWGHWVAADAGVAGVRDDHCPAGLQRMDFDADLLHEGIGGDGRVSTPSALQEFFGLFEPRIFEADLVSSIL